MLNMLQFQVDMGLIMSAIFFEFCDGGRIVQILYAKPYLSSKFMYLGASLMFFMGFRAFVILPSMKFLESLASLCSQIDANSFPYVF